MVSLDDIVLGMAIISFSGAIATIPGWIKSHRELKSITTLHYIKRNYHTIKDSKTLMSWYRIIENKILPTLDNKSETKELAYRTMNQIKKDTGFY